MLHLKWLLLITCGVLLLAQSGQAQNLVQNPGFETTSVEPNMVCANWARTAVNVAGTTDVSLATTGGIGGSKGLYMAAIGGVGANSGSNGAWQIIPVVVGKKYQVHAQWKGDISIQAINNSSAIAEVYVGFGSSPTIRATTETCISRKRNQYNTANIFNVDPNGAVWDWRDINASPNVAWDGGDTITAANSYMTVRFNLQAALHTATVHVYIDNVTVQGCQTAIGQADVNGDCVVNFKDMAASGASWLSCGVTPQSLCW
jgi:hypothetical protein